MKISTKAVSGIALSLLTLFAIFSWTGMDSDLKAYVKRDYATALAQFREGAERGDATAQHNLALMYDKGNGVPQDYAEAMKWYLKAAEQGHADSQYNLGMMYLFGVGVPQDYVEAYKWVILANTKEKEHTKGALSAIADKMSPEQIAGAQEAAQDWKEKHGK